MGKTTGVNRLGAQLASSGVLLLDGALGTELERSGYKTSLPLWSASGIYDAPELIEQIHWDYIASGAQIITANTFRTGRHTLAKAGIGHLAKNYTKKAVELAKNAALKSGGEVLIAGSIAPLEDCYEPDMVPERDVIEREYRDQIHNLTDAGVDLIIVETMINRAETMLAAELLCDTETPYIISFTADDDGRLLDGTTLEEIVNSVQVYSPDALMLNCRAPDIISGNLAILSAHCKCPFGAYANGSGQPGGDTGWIWDNPLEESAYISNVLEWLDMGARIVGGCCGTSPRTIAGMSEAIASRA